MNRIALLLALVSAFAVLPSAGAAATHSKADADARYCLALPTYYKIIKCAEKFL